LFSASFNNAKVIAEIVITSSALTVELLGFQDLQSGPNVELSWKTNGEINFEV